MFDQNIKILVIDDFFSMRKMITKALKTLGMFQSDEQIGLVISDWNMPNKMGIDLLKMVRSNDDLKNLPFIMITAESEAAQVKEALESGVDHYIVVRRQNVFTSKIECRMNELFPTALIYPRG